MEKKKLRNANLELLRIVAMLMVISLHYMGKGNLLVPAFSKEYYPVNSTFAWFIEAICYPATNLYVMITGYFMVSSRFKISKLIKIWIQVFTYSFGFFVLFTALGIFEKGEDFNAFSYLEYILPISRSHYWFATSFFVFYLIAPFLGVFVNKISRKMHLTLIFVLITLFSTFIPSVLYDVAWLEGKGADAGMGIVWFVTLFMIASYIRLYVPENGKKIKYMLISVLCALIMVGQKIIMTYVENKFGILGSLADLPFNYNGVVVTIGSISTFLLFRNMKIKEGFGAKLIRFVSPLTFGIYLIHEHEQIRFKWVEWFKIEETAGKAYLPIHYIGTIIAVFVICAIIELVRLKLFDLIYRIKPVQILGSKLSCIDKFFNKEEGL